jgi:integrase/recombinase XerD
LDEFEDEMTYLTKDELRRLFQAAYNHNREHHLALVACLWHGARVSELINLRGTDVTPDGMVIVKRLKGSLTTMQPIRKDDDILFDESPILTLAQDRKTLRLFPYCRSYFNILMKKYGIEAGIHKSKLHIHALKHSLAMMLWDKSHSLGRLQSYLGHKAASSTLIYLYESNHLLGQQDVAGIAI